MVVCYGVQQPTILTEISYGETARVSWHTNIRTCTSKQRKTSILL